MSKSDKEPAKTPKRKTRKAVKQERGLGRGLSALMSDVRMDTILSDSDSDSAPIIDESVNEPVLSGSEPKTENKMIEPTDAAESNVGGISYVSMQYLVRNPDQPRKYFDQAALQELADSIKKKGVLQPILVRPIPDREDDDKVVYQIVAGERRWTAAGLAGLSSMPAFIREITDQEALEIGVIENVQRQDLNPMEEAQAYQALIAQFGRTQEEVGKAVGKSRSYITNMLRLLALPEKVRDYVARQELSIGHARAIANTEDPQALADMVVKKNMSVRDVESHVRRLKSGAPTLSNRPQKSADIRRLEAELQDYLGLEVDLKHKGPKGELRIRYGSSAQLEMIVARLKDN